MNKIKISLLHLAPITGQLESNKALLLQSLKLCAQMKSDWVISPELWVCGYSFERMIGSDWITHQPDTWMQELCSNMPTWNFNLFLSMPEKDNSTNQLHNTVFVINREGSIIGNYRKIKVLPQSEGWSSPGEEIKSISVDRIPVGILICADAYRPQISNEYHKQGVKALICPSAWGPGDCAPNGEWEQRSLEVDVPLIVCNRTGKDLDVVDWRGSDSIVAEKGERILSAAPDDSTILTFEIDMDSGSILSKEFSYTSVNATN
ncbi:MAG: carbon-nitrogen hydrolase family protein [Dehalococcoidia bacterium]